jgi:hypothetical protein
MPLAPNKVGLDMGKWQDFKEFALKGNALSLAVGVRRLCRCVS